MQYLAGILIVTFIGSIYAGAIAMEFHVHVNNLTAEHLHYFKNRLPKILSAIYFNPKYATVYDGTSQISGIDYLLINRPFSLIIIKWFLLMLFTVGLPVFNLIRDYLDDKKHLDKLFIITFCIILLFVKISFFGSRIKRYYDQQNENKKSL